MSVTSTAPAHLLGVLKHLPAVQYAFAYGSGVHQQPGLYQPHSAGSQHAASSHAGRGKRPMLDFILAVDDPVAWHAANIQRNEAHYSWVNKLGPAAVAGIATYVGVGVHFNTLVPLGDQMVKYGVVSCNDVLDDLLTWRHLYIAGRLHKPVTTLVPHHTIQAACESNANSAALTALLLLPHRFTTKELVHQVVALSYTGDVRMAFAEDPRKVNRIVEGSWSALRSMYVPFLKPSIPDSDTAPTPAASESLNQLPALQSASGCAAANTTATTGPVGPLPEAGALAGVQQLDADTWQQALDTDSRTRLIANLPPALMAKVGQQLGYAVPESHCVAASSTALDLATAAVQGNQHKELVQKALHSTVRSSSMWQAASGVLAAGGGKAFAYVAAKVEKALKSGALAHR